MIAILKMKNTLLLLEDFQQVLFLPGSNKEFFTIERKIPTRAWERLKEDNFVLRC